MSKDIMAAVAHSVREPYSMENLQLGDLRSDEIFIKIQASGICHTDFIAESLVPLPAVFGHEACGIVEEIGAAVKDFKIGDRVVVSYPQCGVCSGCISGKPYLCDEHMPLAFSGTRLDGSRTTASDFDRYSLSFFQQSSFASHAIVQSRNLVKILSDEPSEIVAAIPCGVQTGAGSVINTFNAGPTDSIAVFGVGAVGLSAVIAANIAGLKPIVAIDVVESRLELAKDLGAHFAFNANDPDLIQRIKDCSNKGVRYSLETSGNEQALEAAIASLQTGGTCGMVISPHFGQKYPFSPTEVFKGAKTLCGIIQGSSIPSVFLPKILQWHREGRFPLEPLISLYPFENINQAAADAKTGKAIKAILTMS